MYNKTAILVTQIFPKYSQYWDNSGNVIEPNMWYNINSGLSWHLKIIQIERNHYYPKRKEVYPNVVLTA
jgi:hypothetical protein